MAVVILSAFTDAPARTPSSQPALFDPVRHMRADEVRPGMKGYGLSVFSGTKIERFEVEVISVLNNQLGPKQDVVLIRCRGQGLEHSGAVAGMSGSPIFLIDDQGRERMIGAFALGWEGTKDPIAGVRPIEEMLAVPAGKRDAPPARATADISTWDARPLVARWASGVNDPASHQTPAFTKVAGATGDLSRGLRPLTVPLGVSGGPVAQIAGLPQLLKAGRFSLLETGAVAPPAEAAAARLERGSAIGVPIVAGDLNIAAIGTVTEVIGDQVFAFGHEFNSEGAVELPMGVGYIHSVIPNIAMSFKLGAMLHTDGAIYSDNAVAIAGKIGAAPQTIPVEVTAVTPERTDAQTYRYALTRHRTFTPLGAMMSLAAAATGHARLPDEATVRYTINVQFEGDRHLQIANVTTSATGFSDLGRDLTLPMMLALQNPFKQVFPTKITARFEIRPRVEAATLVAAVTDKSVYRPGDKVRVTLTRRAYHGDEHDEIYEVPLPADLEPGQVQLTIGDSQRYLGDSLRLTPARFQVDSIDDVFGLTRSITSVRGDRLYARLTTTGESLAIGRSTLAEVPASRRKLFSTAQRPGVAVTPMSYTTTFDLDGQFVGSADLQLTISRDPAKVERAAAGTPTPPIAPTAMPPAASQGTD